MVEFHGWATIRFTAENRDCDDEEQLQHAAVIAAQSYVRAMGYGPVSAKPVPAERVAHPYRGALVSGSKANVMLDVRVINGEAQLWAAGAKNHAVPIKQELLELFTYVADLILTAAENHDTDLTVLGSRGLNAASRFLVGSTSTKVTTHAHCPVLVVHPKAAPAPARDAAVAQATLA